MVNNKIENFCRVCGLFQEEAPWGKDGLSPSFDYCSFCGVEFGYQDCTPEAAKHFRKLWLKNGVSWAETNEKPKDWSLVNQLENITKILSRCFLIYLKY